MHAFGKELIHFFLLFNMSIGTLSSIVKSLLKLFRSENKSKPSISF